MCFKFQGRSYQILGYIQLNLTKGDYGNFGRSVDSVKVANFSPQEAKQHFGPEDFNAAYAAHIECAKSDLYINTIRTDYPNAISDLELISNKDGENLQDKDFAAELKRQKLN